jgi:hypothetical protein
MTGNSLQLLSSAVMAASAGLLMALAGLQKKLLNRKELPRCPTCGRSHRYFCACRR